MKSKLFNKLLFPIVILLILSIRFLHFGNRVDDPHAWRQYDTKQYIEGFYYQNDSFFEPSVCWMGGHRTLVLEFPLPEYIIALGYDVFGPHLWVARLFVLISFGFCLFFFYKILKLVFSDDFVAKTATIVLALAPLSIFYSRAIHIDFFAFALSLGMLYFLMRAIRSESNKLMILGLLFGCLAMLEKPPYCFYFALPAIVFAFQESKHRWFLMRAPLFILPVVLMWFWNGYSRSVNAEIPDWSMIPGFNKFTDMWYWYFGNLDQRLDLANWKTVWQRIFNEILGYVGYGFLMIGILIFPKKKEYWWTMSLFIGTILYLVIFLNLNIKHNYYQIPFLFPLAIFMAMGIRMCAEKIETVWKKILIYAVCILFFGVESVRFSEKNYYYVDETFEKVASEIKKNSKSTDVVIVAYGGLSPQCPIILQPAGRIGFSIPQSLLTPELVYELYKKAGVTKLAVVYDGYFTGEFQTFFEAMENKVGIDVDGKGKALYLCDLKFSK